MNETCDDFVGVAGVKGINRYCTIEYAFSIWKQNKIATVEYGKMKYPPKYVLG